MTSSNRLTSSVRVSTFVGAVSALVLAACAAQALAQTTTYSYTQVSRWKEDARSESSGVVLYPQEWYPAKGYDIFPNLQTKSLFPAAIVGNGDNKATSDNLWAALLASPYTMGNSSNLTRARDLSEDWDISFIDPKNPGLNYWFDFYASKVVAWVGYAPTLKGAPQNGAAVMGNNNLLAMGDDQHVWLDADGSLSYYWRGAGTLSFDSTKTTFDQVKAPVGWAGATVKSKLSNLIGYEEGRLYFLEGGRLLHVFDRDMNFVRTDEFYFGGDLQAVSLGDVVDGKVPGVKYIGWDLGPVIAFSPVFMPTAK
ncbi:MAG: hypothetical protein Q7U28_01885 [Aquabacterium sp.]|nr:hypothetical protein [Aquabacterium sp.]